MKKVPRPHVQQLNRIFKRRRAIEFDLEEDVYALNFIPFSPDQIKEKKICVRIDNRILFHLNLEMEFIRKILSDYPNMGDLRQMPVELKEIALEVAAERLLDKFNHHFNCKGSLIPLSATCWSDNIKYDLFIRITRKKDQAEFHAAIKTNRSGIDWIVEQLDQLPQVMLKESNHIPLDIFSEVGWTILPLKVLDGIEPNDIIVMDSDFSLKNPRIIICSGPVALFRGSVDSMGKIKIEEKLFKNTEENMKEIPKVDGMPPKDKIDKQIDDIPVKLVFQLGEARMKFGELINIQPGYIFEMGSDLNKPVTIKVNGRPVGKGELVEIGDRTGVRVLQLENY